MKLSIVLRIVLLLLGMAVAALGIAVVACAEIGNTPISTVPFVLTKITGFSFGTTTFIINTLFVLGQILLLRKKFHLYNLLQLPSVAVFGFCIDCGMAICSGVHLSNYWYQWLFSITGNCFLAIGIVMQIRANLIVQPGEGIVLALSIALRKAFGTMKIINDITLVSIAAFIGFVSLQSFYGIGEGTLCSAILVGLIVKFINQLINKYF